MDVGRSGRPYAAICPKGGREPPIGGLPSELLQAILGHLPAEQIRSAAQVSRHWRDVSVLPMKTACLQAGLKPPIRDRSDWWLLQATKKRVEKRWAVGVPVSQQPTHTFRSPAPRSYTFYDKAMVVGSTGAYIQGVTATYVALPGIGDRGIPICRTLDDSDQHLPQSFSVFGVGAIDAFLKSFVDHIELFDTFNLSKLAAAGVSEPVSAVHSLGKTLVTTHADGLRLWALPDLSLERFIKVDRRWFGGVEMSRDQSRVVAYSETDGEVFFWERSGRQIAKLVGTKASIDNERRQILVTHERKLFRYNFDGHRVFRRTIPRGSTFALLSTPDHAQALMLDSDGAAWTIDTLRRDRYASSQVVTDSAGDLNVVGISRDGRWVVGLASNGDILLWDQQVPLVSKC